MTRSLTLERLEIRDIPSGGAIPEGISKNAFGVLSINGNGSDDDGHVWVADGQVHATLSHTTYIEVGGEVIPSTIFDPEKIYPVAQVTKIAFYGHEGNDSFTNDTAIKSTAKGDAGNDVLVGGTAVDKFFGGDGDDMLEGRWGNDDLRGGAGSDAYEFAPLGRDTVAALGWDKITEVANLDADELDFSALDVGVKVNLALAVFQTVISGKLSLTLSSGRGIENVTGTPWADKITGNGRANTVLAQGGNDTVTGAGGADILWGEGGNDDLEGNGGNDVLHGGADDDMLYGGNGTNTITDGAGNDLVDFTGNAAGVQFATNGGNDTVTGSQFPDQITGSSGNDQLDGRGGNDTVTGGSGNDSVKGGGGSNVLSDGPGNDTVDFRNNAVAINYTTGGGNDTVIGTSSDDQIKGSAGDDKLVGGAGHDRLFGKGGTDEVYGGAGNDWLEAGSAGEVAVGGDGTDYNAHQWALNGATFDDVLQRGIGSCVFLSALSSGALQGIDLAGRISYLGNYTYNVQLFRIQFFDPDASTIYNQHVTFDGSILSLNGTRLDPGSAEDGEFWTILYQRAYLEMMNAIDVDFRLPDYGLYAVTGRPVLADDWNNASILKIAVDAGMVVTAWDADNTNRVYDLHSYTVTNVYQQNGIWRITLRNPWGIDVRASDIANGTKVATGSNDDGIIDMKWEDFKGHHDFDSIGIS